MSSVSAIRAARKTWLPFVVFAQVTAGLATLVGIATSPLIGLVTAAVLMLALAVVRSLNAASRTIDAIFAEELDSPVQRHTDVR